MNKAFVKEATEEELSPLPEMPEGVRNYITPGGFTRLQRELGALQASRSPQEDVLTHVVREREQRIHYLQSRIDGAEVVDASHHADGGRVFFGARVTYVMRSDGTTHQITIVGLDEIDLAQGFISWRSPVAQALLGAEEGDSVILEKPDGDDELMIASVRYASAEG